MTLELSDKELKLLLSILKEAEEERSNMGCNDPYPNEERLFSKKERIEIQELLHGSYWKTVPDEERDGFLFNSQYVDYIIHIIKKQTRKKKEN